MVLLNKLPIKIGYFSFTEEEIWNSRSNTNNGPAAVP
jgi:hypothetical protein